MRKSCSRGIPQQRVWISNRRAKSHLAGLRASDFYLPPARKRYGIVNSFAVFVDHVFYNQSITLACRCKQQVKRLKGERESLKKGLLKDLFVSQVVLSKHGDLEWVAVGSAWGEGASTDDEVSGDVKGFAEALTYLSAHPL